MDDLQFMDGLLWYLRTRDWAFEKIQNMSKRSQEPLDTRMYHYLYFSNLLGAVDYVNDYLNSFNIIANFEAELGHDNYSYIRELRNSVVHRGFNPAPVAGVTDENHVFVFCPPVINDRKMSKSYTCTFAYTVELAVYCNNTSNKVIFQALDGCGLFNRSDLPTKAEALDVSRRYLEYLQKPMTQAVLENLQKVVTKLRVEDLKTILDPACTGVNC
jgi:hypothetical protein